MDISTINPSSAIPRSDLKSQEMKRDGHFTPDEIMYNSILDGCTKQRNVSEALRVLEVTGDGDGCVWESCCRNLKDAILENSIYIYMMKIVYSPEMSGMLVPHSKLVG